MVDIERQIDEFIEDNTENMISDLASLVAIPSVRGAREDGYPFGREPARALEKFLEIAKRMGFAVKNHENYVGTVDFFQKGEPTLGILCHLDVVPVGTGWASPPFELARRRGYLYGRGVIDDKGPAVSVLYAMYALKKLGVKLNENVRFIVGTDEECGSSDLAYYKKKEALPPRLFTPDGSYPIINIEKGVVRGAFEAQIASVGEKTVLSLCGGDVVNAVPGTCTATVKGFDAAEIAAAAEKIGGATFTIDEKDGSAEILCAGKSAHASLPQGGTNAITAMIKLLASLDTDDGVSAVFDELSHIFVYGETDGASVGIKMSDKISGALTFVHSMASYDGKTYSGKFDIRFPVTQSSAAVREKIEKALACRGVKLTEWNGVEPHYVDGNSDFVKTLLETYEHVTGKRGRCIAIGGGTYVHDTNGVAFGAEFIGDKNNMHGANERMSIKLFKMNVRMYADAIIRLCK